MTAASFVNPWASLAALLSGAFVFYLYQICLSGIFRFAFVELWWRTCRQKNLAWLGFCDAVFPLLARLPWCAALLLIFFRGNLSSTSFALALASLLLLRALDWNPWRKDRVLLGKWFQETALSPAHTGVSLGVGEKLILSRLASKRVADVVSPGGTGELAVIVFVLIRVLARNKYPYQVDFISFGFAWFALMKALFRRRRWLASVGLSLLAWIGVIAVWNDLQALSVPSLYYGSALVFSAALLVLILRRRPVQAPLLQAVVFSPDKLRSAVQKIELGFPAGWRSNLAPTGVLGLQKSLSQIGGQRLLSWLDLFVFFLGSIAILTP